MQQTRSTPLQYPIRITIAGVSLPKPLVMDVLLALGLAVLWWLVALLLLPTEAVNVQTDQRSIFMPAGLAFLQPYSVRGFYNPPWAAALFAPFARLPIDLSVLLQLALFFVTLTLVIHKFGGRRSAVLIALTSFVALDTALELNVEWMVCLGWLAPARWSAPLLVIKPQTALGYYFSVKPRELLYAVLIGSLFLLASLFIWQDWIPQLITSVRSDTWVRPFNFAPMAFITPYVSIPIGLFLAWRAFRKQDAPLGVLAWLFFMPYVALYGVLIHLAMLAIRAPRAALVASLVLWILFGLPLIAHVFQAVSR